MGRPRVRPILTVQCSYCQTSFERVQEKGRNKTGRYFCDSTCFYSWVRENPENVDICNRYPQDDLIAELERVTKKLGHIPSSKEMREHSIIGPKPYARCFGTWENAKRLMGFKPDYATFEPQDTSPEDGAWLAGLIDGEGCFRLQRPSPNNPSRAYSPIFCMSLRSDDLPALNEMRRIIGSKSALHLDHRESEHKKGRENAQPSFKFYVRDLPTLAYHLIPILERYPLRSKKKFDLKIFKVAINVLLQRRTEGRLRTRYTDEERDLLDRLYLALREIKEYKSSYPDIIAKYNLPINPTAHGG